MLGHGIAAKLSQRLGEGVLNGLLTARLGLAAIDVTQPLPYSPRLPRPPHSPTSPRIFAQARWGGVSAIFRRSSFAGDIRPSNEITISSPGFR